MKKTVIYIPFLYWLIHNNYILLDDNLTGIWPVKIMQIILLDSLNSPKLILCSREYLEMIQTNDHSWQLSIVVAL